MHIYVQKAVEALYGNVHRIPVGVWWDVWSGCDQHWYACGVQWFEWPLNQAFRGPTAL